MKRRLRKKLRVREFRELGFEVAFQLPTSFDERALDDFFDSFIGQAIEGRDLLCGGGGGREWDVTIFRSGRKSATDEDRTAVAAWLAGHPDASAVRVGPLIDMWHPA